MTFIADQIKISRPEHNPKPHWWDEAADAFYEFQAVQDEEFQELPLLQQIDAYADAMQAQAE